MTTGRPLFSKPCGICHRHGVSVGSEDWLVAPLNADAHRSSFVWQTLRYLLQSVRGVSVLAGCATGGSDDGRGS